MGAKSIRADNLVSKDFPALLEGIQLAINARVYKRGDVLGRIDKDVPVTGTPGGGNTGNGTMTNVEGRIKTIAGVYTFICTAISANGGTFAVTDPNADELPDAEVGTTYDGDFISVDINDGVTDYAISDSFTVTVVVGSKEYRLADKGLTDGAEVARRILATDEVDATAAAAAASGFKTGAFDQNSLYFTTGNDIEDHRDAMEAKSLFIELNED